MLGKVFGALVCAAFLFAGVGGRMNEIGTAGLSGAAEAVTVTLSLCGLMCLWSGVMRVWDKVGVTKALTRLFMPLLKRMYSRRVSEESLQAIAANYSANLLGLGNAAIPLGLRAMESLKKSTDPDQNSASGDMVMFAALNTAPLQLFPTTLAALRTSHGSVSPFEILLPIWLCIGATFLFGTLLCKAFDRLFR